MNRKLQILLSRNIPLSRAFAILLKKEGFYMFNRWMRNKGIAMEYVLYIHRLAATI